MLSRSLLHLRRQCQQELIKSGKYTKEITNLYHKGSQGDKGSFWSEFVPFLIRASQRNHYQPHQAPQNQVTHEFDWQNFTDFIKRFNQRGPIQRNTEQVTRDNKVFEIKLDVQHYEPGELSITISDSKLIIKGQHEMKEDEHGTISRQFHREYDNPEDVIKETFESSVEDGILTLKGRMKWQRRQLKLNLRTRSDQY